MVNFDIFKKFMSKFYVVYGRKKCLKLVCNSKIIEIPVIFANLLKVKQEIAETLILKHEYLVKSKVDNEVFQSFVNMWVYQEELMLDKNNVVFYRELNREFELSLLEEKLKEYENKSKEKDEAGKEKNKYFTISEITQILQNDGKKEIREISERLDDYLDLYNDDLMKIDSTLLIRLFNDPRRILKQHNKAL